ncbi:MAG: methyltransferase domain-containing protein [Calditrichaeota bacterium]|nr:methyltransferase domain-containing protein [Calditrichota bacterium]MCB9368458.1 methyltransferase domain-containing protein [Calditrichota bacterium]
MSPSRRNLILRFSIFYLLFSILNTVSLQTLIFKQFGKPSGFLGRIVGYILANRPSNIERGEWTISLLNLQPTDRVLETGYGSGLTIEKMSKQVTAGQIVGIDYSDVMYKVAGKRNRQAIAAGRVKLYLGPAHELPPEAGQFDKIVDTNCFKFWDHKVAALIILRARLNPGGMIALTDQPRHKGATNQDAKATAEKYANYLKEAGFTNIRTEYKQMLPVSAICVMGERE